MYNYTVINIYQVSCELTCEKVRWTLVSANRLHRIRWSPFKRSICRHLEPHNNHNSSLMNIYSLYLLVSRELTSSVCGYSWPSSIGLRSSVLDNPPSFCLQRMPTSYLFPTCLSVSMFLELFGFRSPPVFHLFVLSFFRRLKTPRLCTHALRTCIQV